MNTDDLIQRARDTVLAITPDNRKQSLLEETLNHRQVGYKRARKRFGAISPEEAQETANKEAGRVEELVKEAEAFAEKVKNLAGSVAAETERAYLHAKENMLDAWYAAGQADAFEKMASWLEEQRGRLFKHISQRAEAA